MTLELRFLGEMEIVRDGRSVELPPSKKTRGLLAYLVLTGRPHRRERLCQLLWDVADDPRGALRWSLSRLRPLVNEPGATRLLARKDSVSFEPLGARVDVVALRRRLAGRLDGTGVGELLALAEEFRGELLEGLDLSDFLDFQAWCAAEREEARKAHATLLRTLLERLRGDPEAALVHARALAGLDPLDDAARESLVRLLAAAGRREEAERQVEAARRLGKELGRPVDPALEAALRVPRAAPPPAPLPLGVEPPRAAPRGDALLVGRAREAERLAGALDTAPRARCARVLLVTGEPGLGKSRLLAEARREAARRGATVLEARAFEAETGRPFGPWMDALRQLPEIGPGAHGDLGVLLPGAAEPAVPPSRERLFAAVVDVLSERARAAMGGSAVAARPVVLTLDDVQWLDAASAELLHFVVRTSVGTPLVVVAAARSGELPDNEPVQRALHSLRDLGLLEEIPLQPLGLVETRELLAESAPGADADSVFAACRGNPLFALELVRSGPGGSPGSLPELVRRRVERLPADCGDVLRWAAALGSGVDVGRLAHLTALDLDRLLPALELLERHSLLRVADEARGTYAFAHEVVRNAVYSGLSQPRRRLMHLRIAERLEGSAGDAEAAELAYHAALAGERALAASACVRAGRLFLRQLAPTEAWATARRGRHHAGEVAEPARTGLVLELLQVELQARRPADVTAAAEELSNLAQRALDQGDLEHARLGFHMLAYLRWEEGDLLGAQQQMARAEEIGRAGDDRAQIVAMAEAARCLVLLERELPRAEALALEAQARAARAGVRTSAIADAQGMLRRHQGRGAEAAELFSRARLEARRDGDALGEFQALEHLVVLRQEQAQWVEARGLAVELEALSRKVREGSEGPFARALLALCRRALGEAGAGQDVDLAAGELRVADAKLRLSYALTLAARADLADGDAARARERAAEAYRAALALGRPTETLAAGVALLRACAALGDEAEAGRLAAALRAVAAGASEVARRELLAALEEGGTT